MRSETDAADLGGVRAAAANIFVHCFPLMLADVVRRAHPMAFHQFHQITHDGGSLAPGLAEDDPRIILTSAWVDVGEEPIVLRLPHTHGRYFNVTLIDSAGEPFEAFGSRTGDEAGLDVALVGPRWRGELPSGLRARRTPSDSIWAVSRIHAHSTLDRTEALGVAKRQCLAWLRPDADRRRPNMTSLEPPPSPCLRQLAEMPPATYFHRLDLMFERAPAAFQASVRPPLGEFREALGGPPPADSWPDGFAAALAGGFADGLASIRTASETAAGSEGLGWAIRAGGVHDRNMGALARAARAFVSLGAPLRDDLLAFVCDRDESGRALSGQHVYRLRFPPDATPPTHAFWRLSAKAARQESRHDLGDRSDLRLNVDGTLDILVQRDAPSPDQIANWLPAPEGAFSLVMRLYSPRASALSGAWRMPPVERLDSGSPSRFGERRMVSPAAMDRPRMDMQAAALAWRMSP